MTPQSDMRAQLDDVVLGTQLDDIILRSLREGYERALNEAVLSILGSRRAPDVLSGRFVLRGIDDRPAVSPARGVSALPPLELTMSDRAAAMLRRGSSRRDVAEALGCSPSLVAAVARRVEGRQDVRRGGLGGLYGRVVFEVIRRNPQMSRSDVARLVGCTVARVGQVANYSREHPKETPTGGFFAALDGLVERGHVYTVDDVREMRGYRRGDPSRQRVWRPSFLCTAARQQTRIAP